jgi:DNA mismatch endonuclease (patch repair protein)
MDPRHRIESHIRIGFPSTGVMRLGTRPELSRMFLSETTGPSRVNRGMAVYNSRMTVESWASSASVRKSMQANKSRDTRPELAVRRALHSRGFRYRVSVRPVATLRRSADIVFRRDRIAVFIDGCFWHGCPTHYREPTLNKQYWQSKVRRNIERDTQTGIDLTNAGWTVLRFWAHEDATASAIRIGEVVSSYRRNENSTRSLRAVNAQLP